MFGDTIKLASTRHGHEGQGAQIKMKAGNIIDAFVHDENLNIEYGKSAHAAEIALVDELYRIFIDFLNSSEIVNSSIYYFSCSLCKTQLLKAISDLLRGHVNSAFASIRISLDATLYSLLLAEGRISEEDYKSFDDKKRQTAINQLGQEIDNAEWKIVRFVFRSRKLVHPFAHGGFDYFADRLRMTPDGIEYSNFQNLCDDLQVKKHLLDLIWISGGCMKSYIEISSRLFNEECSSYFEGVDSIKQKILHARCLYGFH